MKEKKHQEQTRRREEKKENDGRMACQLEIRSTKDLVVFKHLIEQYKGIQKQAAVQIEKKMCCFRTFSFRFCPANCKRADESDGSGPITEKEEDRDNPRRIFRYHFDALDLYPVLFVSDELHVHSFLYIRDMPGSYRLCSMETASEGDTGTMNTAAQSWRKEAWEGY